MNVDLSQDLPVRAAEALRPPERAQPSEWAAANMILPPGLSSEPGRLNLGRTPYLAEVLDAVAEPGIEEVDVVKGTQLGATTALQVLLAYWAACDPGPALLVYPNEGSAKEALVDRILPVLRASPPTRALLPARQADLRQAVLKLDSMPIHAAWSGSAQSLASRAIRYLGLDEVDKYLGFVGKEADPVSLARERTATYQHRRRIFMASTPTTRQGIVWRAWETCPDRRHYHVACPSCGEYQRLVMGRLRWPERNPNETRHEQAERIEVQGLARYRCEHCETELEESMKARMLTSGRWASEGQRVLRDGTVEGERPESRRVAFHLTGLLSPWRTWSTVAGMFLRAKGSESGVMNFRNSVLGECYETTIAAPKLDAVRAKAAAAREAGIRAHVVPPWAVALVTGADVQLGHAFYTTMAFGRGFRSRLVAYGRVDGPGMAGLEQLVRVALGVEYPVEGRDPAAPGMMPAVLWIDSGYRTSEAYSLAAMDPARIFACMGARTATPASHVSRSRVTCSLPGQGDQPIERLMIDTNYFKDMVASRLRALPGEEGCLELNGDVDEELCRQLTSEHKALVRERGGAVFRWEPVSQGVANHYWDCVVLATACAHQYRIGLFREEDQVDARHEADAHDPSRDPEPTPWIKTNGRWM
jgi:phage terminase large subunit GpA-like protein